VITGASSGIGRECALQLAKLGFRVFAGVRREDDGKALQQQAPAQITPLLLDITNAEAIATAAQIVGVAVGDKGLAGLVNNAGITIAGPLEFVPIAMLRQQFEVDVIGQIAVTQAFLPLIRQGRGRIVNISSILGKSLVPLLGPYCISKFAFEAFSDELRMELLRSGIAVSVIEPGVIKTPIWHKSLALTDTMEQQLPPAALGIYGVAMARLREIIAQLSRTALPTQVVAKVVSHALTARHPRIRYVVAKGSRAQMLLNLLPTWLHDQMMVWALWRADHAEAKGPSPATVKLLRGR
jgi:NAD(P)-dependent dehydrogenase (short-subunit alcohol dehydrogenase family)